MTPHPYRDHDYWSTLEVGFEVITSGTLTAMYWQDERWVTVGQFWF